MPYLEKAGRTLISLGNLYISCSFICLPFSCVYAHNSWAQALINLSSGIALSWRLNLTIDKLTQGLENVIPRL